MGVKSWPGGFIQPIPPTPSGPFQDGRAPGVWTLDQVAYWTQQGLWPIAGNVNLRGLFGGGGFNTIQYISFASAGNAVDFGDLTIARSRLGAVGSTTRAVFGGGQSSDTNVMDYVTISSIGNAIDFGDLSQVTAYLAVGNCGSATRGIFAGGQNPSTFSFTDAVQYITIASTGNSISFGNLDSAVRGQGACSSSTRGVFAGGRGSGSTFINNIQYITIASTGNTTDFGDMSTASDGLSGCSSSTRGVFSLSAEFDSSNVLEYITIATTGNATDFGDLSYKVNSSASCSSQTIGLFAGGQLTFGGAGINTISQITIASTGNATDWGDLLSADGGLGLAGTSNAHGGL